MHCFAPAQSAVLSRPIDRDFLPSPGGGAGTAGRCSAGSGRRGPGERAPGPQSAYDRLQRCRSRPFPRAGLPERGPCPGPQTDIRTSFMCHAARLLCTSDLKQAGSIAWASPPAVILQHGILLGTCAMPTSIDSLASIPNEYHTHACFYVHTCKTGHSELKRPAGTRCRWQGELTSFFIHTCRKKTVGLMEEIQLLSRLPATCTWGRWNFLFFAHFLMLLKLTLLPHYSGHG